MYQAGEQSGLSDFETGNSLTIKNTRVLPPSALRTLAPANLSDKQFAEQLG